MLPALGRWLPLACAAALLLTGGTASAGMVVGVQSVTALAGTTGDTLDITLTNTGPSAVAIGGFSFGLSTTSPDITFTDATVNTTTATYIFAGNSLFGPDITSATGPPLTAADLSVTPAGTTLASGATFGLGHVFFNVSSTAPGGPITASLVSADTSLSDAAGHNVPVNTLDNGTITVIPAATVAVPAPPSVIPLLTGALGLLGYGWRRRRHAAA
jgi:hypothetical protein